MGKLSDDELKKLLTCIRKDPRVLIPPTPGYDAGVHLLGDKYVVVAADPCIGVPEEWFGWLLINYAASDVAVFGAKPEFCTITLLGPPSTKPHTFQTVMKQVCSAANELNMTIVRGHTGTYSGIVSLLGVCTAYGTVEKKKLVTSGGAKHGDLILCTKSVGLETLINFALTQRTLTEKLLGLEKTNEFASQVSMESCVREALKLAEIKGVHAMHDATEGGFTTALNELADASGLGFEIEFEKLPVSREIKRLQEHFGLSDNQVLATSSTGTMLAAVEPSAKTKVEDVLREIGISVSFVGVLTEDKARRIVKGGKRLSFPRVADDPYAMILSGKA